MRSPSPVVANPILERLNQLMTPFHHPEYVHDPATTDNFFRLFLDIVRLAPSDEHTSYQDAALQLVDTLSNLPEDVRPATSVLDTFLLAYAEFTLGREVCYAKRWAEIKLDHATRARGAVRLIQEDVANGLLGERSLAMPMALRTLEQANREYEEAEENHTALSERC